MSNRHREGIEAAHEILSVREIEREDVENAIRAYHEKAFHRQNNAPTESVSIQATYERIVGPWTEIEQ